MSYFDTKTIDIIITAIIITHRISTIKLLSVNNIMLTNFHTHRGIKTFKKG